MQQRVIVELTGITKKYGRRQLFSNITQRIGSGECLAVTGRNGSGKSTLLKIIAGVTRPSAGTVKVYIDGREIAAHERIACFGMVSPEISLYSAMTGYENLQFIAKACGVKITSERALECFHTVGLTGRCDDMVSTYSTGMRQRLKFAILAALNPPVWLLDEPSSNLDEGGKKIVAKLVTDALSQQAAVFIATNESEEADYAGQKIALV